MRFTKKGEEGKVKQHVKSINKNLHNIYEDVRGIESSLVGGSKDSGNKNVGNQVGDNNDGGDNGAGDDLRRSVFEKIKMLVGSLLDRICLALRKVWAMMTSIYHRLFRSSSPDAGGDSGGARSACSIVPSIAPSSVLSTDST